MQWIFILMRKCENESVNNENECRLIKIHGNEIDTCVLPPPNFELANQNIMDSL